MAIIDRMCSALKMGTVAVPPSCRAADQHRVEWQEQANGQRPALIPGPPRLSTLRIAGSWNVARPATRGDDPVQDLVQLGDPVGPDEVLEVGLQRRDRAERGGNAGLACSVRMIRLARRSSGSGWRTT